MTGKGPTYLFLKVRRYLGRNIINVIGGLVLVTLTVAAGVSVYSVMERQAETLLTQSLATSLRGRMSLFKNQITQSLINTRIIATRPVLIATLRRLDRDPHATARQAFLQRGAQSFLAAYGLTAVSFHLRSGREIAGAGHLLRASQLQLPITSSQLATLLWKGQFFLRTRMPMTDRQGQRIGSVLTESRLPLLTHALIHPRSIGEPDTLAVCAPLGDAMRCVAGIPNRAGISVAKVFVRLPRTLGGRLLPMGHALAGQTGVLFTRDYLHNKVVAAYAPISHLGLGMVLMVRQSVLDGPITDQLWIIGPLLGILLLAGMLLLRGMVTPLVREMASSEPEVKVSDSKAHESGLASQIIWESGDDGTNASSQDERPRLTLNTPASVVAVAGVIVLVGEFLIMVAIDVLQPLFTEVGPSFWIFIDPITLTAIVSPALYILIFRPMRNQRIALEGQLAILRHNKQLDTLIEAIPDAVFLKDGEGHWLIVNEPAKQLFELHHLPWQGKTEKELADLQPALRAAHEGCLLSDEKAWQSRQLFVSEERLVRGDGLCVILETRKMPMFDKEGRRKGLTIIARDVTERHRIEQELHVAAIAFETGEGILITDRNARILRVNRAFVRLTGYSAEEMIGQTPAMFHSGRQDAAFYRDLWETLIRERYWQGEIWNRRKDGTVYLEWQTITAVTDAKQQVTHYVGVSSDITLRKKAEEEIHKLAFYDPLTKLPNRSLLGDRLQQARAYGARHKTYGALLFIDLDNFKILNDTQGHPIGDLLLIEVAERLQRCVRPSDTAARLGGDEFVVVLVGLSDEVSQAITQAQGVGKKLLATLNKPYFLQGREHYSSASIGICLFLGDEVALEDLLKHADAAMYQAKAAGRNVLRFFDPHMQAVLEGRAVLEADLHQALVRQQLRLFYQAQVDENGEIIGAEALLRWQHPERGLVLPLDFIPLAEETGLIVAIGQWVLQEACAQLKMWQGNPRLRHLGLAVNVSARQFRQLDFVAQVQNALAITGVDAGHLTLELTESLVLDNISEGIDKMQTLRDIGVHLSLDDFGTGQSSLTHLRRLPLDQIKIDESFIGDVTTDPSDAVIVQTIIGMAKNLGLDLIAEGVETEAQHDFLKRNGCHRYQGYLFGRPDVIADFEAKV